MKIIIPEYKIERRVRAMAHKLSDEHKLSGNDKTPVMICVLNGAFIFFSDLVKDMGIEIEVDFIRAKSYSGMDNSRGVTFTKEIETDPSEVKVVTLVDRKSGTFKVDYTCFPDMGEEWFVGYGFDLDGLCRNYRNIYDSKSK